MLLSHEVMLRQQDSRSTKSVAYDFYCATAILLRGVGKLLASLNALWLIASSLMEFIGLYDNCWCSGDVPGLGDSGWIVLFKNKQDLRNSAMGPWIGGTFLTFFTCGVVGIFFHLGRLEAVRQRRSK